MPAEVSRIHPFDCSCTGCRSLNTSVPANKASYEQLADMLSGELLNDSGLGFVMTTSYGPNAEAISSIVCLNNNQRWERVVNRPLAPVQTRTRFKRDLGPTPPMAEMSSDELVTSVLKYIGQVTATRDPALRLQLVAQWLQPAVGELLRQCVVDGRTADLPWVQIGELAGTNYAVMHRQFLGSGPMLAASSRVSYGKVVKDDE